MQRLRPEYLLVSLVEKEAPKAHTQLGHDPSGGLGCPPAREAVPRLRDVVATVLTEDAGRVVVPLPGSAKAFGTVTSW